MLADEAFVGRVETFQEVGDEGELLVVVVVHDRCSGGGQGGEQSSRLGLVLPGRHDEDAAAVMVVSDAPDEATAFEPVEGGSRR